MVDNLFEHIKFSEETTKCAVKISMVRPLISTSKKLLVGPTNFSFSSGGNLYGESEVRFSRKGLLFISRKSDDHRTNRGSYC